MIFGEEVRKLQALVDKSPWQSQKSEVRSQESGVGRQKHAKVPAGRRRS